jgi:hypothetical protein
MTLLCCATSAPGIRVATSSQVVYEDRGILDTIKLLVA